MKRNQEEREKRLQQLQQFSQTFALNNGDNESVTMEDYQGNYDDLEGKDFGTIRT